MQRLDILEGQNSKKLDTTHRKDYFVDGTINGAPVDALPDTGAGACFISPKIASSLNLVPNDREKRTVRLANGALVESPGTVDVKWRFDKQLNDIPVKCWVLPGCVHDMILGKRFLDATKTLTKFRKRIKSRLMDVSRRLRLQRIEVERHVSQHLCGNLNGYFTTALADTGSDAMFVSSEYARRCGFEVDRGPDARCEVEFANGSTQWTAGVVRDALWTIGRRSIRSDFLVLDNLSEDVVLSKDYLFEEDVYTTADEYFIEFETRESGFYDLLNIRLIGKYGKALHDVEENYLNDSKTPLSPTSGLPLTPMRSQESRCLSARHARQRATEKTPHS
jgi:predicted aspartyl protease